MKKERLSVSVPRGMRDYGPEIALQRQYIVATLAGMFAKYGFLPLETPAMEQASTLVGHYGEEGEKLIFYVLNSGEYLKKLQTEAPEHLLKGSAQALRPRLAEKALRYDLTVPLARFVAAEGQRLPLPFRRYQMQPVWRADRPQQGRYREFLQCDADIMGSRSLLCEIDMLLLIDEAFCSLQLPEYVLRINHRGILSAVAQHIGAPEKENDLCIALDKLEKVGQPAVEEELRRKGFSEAAVNALRPLFQIRGPFKETLPKWQMYLKGAAGPLEELRELSQLLEALAPQLSLQMDASLARGLAYYTGLIFEVTHPQGHGSLLGGGRYDQLTARFSDTVLPGIGLSFGLERIHELMLRTHSFSEEELAYTQVLLAHFSKEEQLAGLKVLQQLRAAGLRCELYPSPEKLKKQFLYAERKKISYILFAGEKECQAQRYGLKNIRTGKQIQAPISEIIALLRTGPAL